MEALLPFTAPPESHSSEMQRRQRVSMISSQSGGSAALGSLVPYDENEEDEFGRERSNSNRSGGGGGATTAASMASTAGGTIVIEGQLFKRGEFLRNWKSRYFALDIHGRLRYWTEEPTPSAELTSTKPQGALKLSECMFDGEPQELPDDPLSFAIREPSGSQQSTWLLLCDSKENKAQWARTFATFTI